MLPERNSLPLRVLPCSRQDGKVRYPGKEDVEAPSIAMFRNNLSALSQYRNLLFVAFVDKVYVYTPSFPEQNITTKPKLVINLPTSQPGLMGFMDPNRPHAVNHLIVGDIGDEEVVVVACDDGDVISYTVRSISLAIDEGANIVFGPDPYEDQKLKRYRQSGWANLILPVADPHKTPGFRILAAWFHENVGASAWGLATHKGARLLAVSSNTKEINIFMPSLGPSWLLERHVNGDTSDWNRALNPRSSLPDKIERYTTWETRNSTASRDPSIGRKVTLRGHVANIPNIAFCDNSLDPEGKYLASTDIDGYTIVWDIWGCSRIIETLGNAGSRMSNKLYPESSFYSWNQMREVGLLFAWILELRDSVFNSEGPFNTFGCACRVDESNTLIDNSEAGRLVHNNSQWHPGFLALGSVPGIQPGGTIHPALQIAVQFAAATTAIQDPELGEESEDEEMLDTDDPEYSYFDEETAFATFGEAGFDEAGLQPPGPGVLSPNILPLPPEAPQLLSFQSDEDSISSDEDSDLPDLEEMPVEDQAPAEEDLKTLFLDFAIDPDRFSDVTHNKTHPSFVDLPFNLLQTDEKDIHMFRDIRFSTDLTRQPHSSYSHVLCQQALNQKMPPGFSYLTQMERLNMIAQIPELGVVVIGNQVGRVGILTMTRWEAQKQSGYKIECILPFDSEEGKGLRPRKPLMGMAVGPIQGQETALPQESPRIRAQSPRRFRLLMTYCDHTILSYEISRPDEEEKLLVA